MKLAVCFTNFGPYHLARLLRSQFDSMNGITLDRVRGCR